MHRDFQFNPFQVSPSYILRELKESGPENENGIGHESMFGCYTQIQFSIFKSKNLWTLPLNILFGSCFLYLFPNTNTILLTLKSTLLRTTFCCFMKLYLVSFNKIIIFLFLVYFFSPSLHHRNSLSFSTFPLSWWVL
jgi:hypothetical protein